MECVGLNGRVLEAPRVDGTWAADHIVALAACDEAYGYEDVHNVSFQASTFQCSFSQKSETNEERKSAGPKWLGRMESIQ